MFVLCQLVLAAAAATTPPVVPPNPIRTHLGELAIEVQAPAEVRKEKDFDLRVRARINPSLRKDINDVIKRVHPGKPEPVPDILDAITLELRDAKGSVDIKPRRSLIAQEDRDYQLVWEAQAQATVTGPAAIIVSLAGKENPPTIHVLTVSDSVSGEIKALLKPYRALFLMIAIGAALIISDSFSLFVVCALVLALLPSAYRIPSGILLITILTLNHLTHKSLAQFIATGWHRDLTWSIGRLHERARRLASSALMRARLQLLLSITAAIAGLIYVGANITDFRPASVKPSDTGALVVASLPGLAIFVASQLAARFFMQEYRNSLNDHRHYEETLQDREWQALVLDGDLDKDRFDQLVVWTAARGENTKDDDAKKSEAEADD